MLARPLSCFIVWEANSFHPGIDFFSKENALKPLALRINRILVFVNKVVQVVMPSGSKLLLEMLLSFIKKK